MDTTIEQRVAMDEALVLHAQRLRIGGSNFRLLSDIKSKESTLQLVYDATAIVHHHVIRFKMDNKKHIVNLESFRDMLHICPRVHSQSFDELPFEEEILAFICFLGHSAAIKMLTDVNINKLYQPWRSFAAIINKCLTGKSFGYDIVEHKNTKKSNEMYYPWFTKFSALLPIELTNEEIMNFNAYKEYYAIATGAAPPKPKDRGKQAAKASKAKSLSALSEVAMSEAQQLKPNSTDDEGDDEEGNDGDDDKDDDGEEGNDNDDDQEIKRDDDKDDEEEGGDEDQEYNEDEYDEETRDEESFDPIPHTPENNKDEGNGKEDLGLNVGGEERHVEEEEEDELYRDVTINQGRGIQETLEVKDFHVTLTPINPDGQQQSSSVSSQFVTSMLNLTLDVGMESIFKTTSQLDVQTPTFVAPLPMSAPTMTPSTIATITTTSQVLILLTTAPRTIIQNLSNFGSLFGFDNRLGTLEANFYEFMQTNQFSRAVSAIPGIALVEAYESDKIILDTYGDTITLKRRQDDDADKNEEPSAGPDRGSKRRREGKEPESASAPTKTATRSAGRSIIIQRRVEDLQLGVESYQKKLNLTKPDTYRSDLKHKEAYTAYSNLRGFIYQNKDKMNRLIRIDEQHKFSDGTLTDVRTALDDRLKGIRMQYFPQSYLEEK
nr:hypothetical protein [Tanacetum cinerariifolium]